MTVAVIGIDIAPQEQHIDPGVGQTRRGIGGHGKRSRHRSRAPRLNPRHATRLQVGDDLVGDVVIETGPVGA